MRKTAVLLAGLLFGGSAYATIITDQYVGWKDQGYGDVIGSTTYFQINHMDVDITGSTMSVTVDTNLYDTGGGLGTFAGYTNTPWGGGNGIGGGYLFLSSDGWNPYGSASNGWKYDHAGNGEDWEYVVSVNDQWGTGNLGGALYAITASTDILLTQDFMSGAIYRVGQEVAIDTTGHTAITTADVSTTSNPGAITYSFDIAGTDLAGASEIGLHWAMTCGNDTIEGVYTVPEPTTLSMLFMGLMLIGAAVGRRRRLGYTII